jgi:hypothetical protein
MREDQYRIGTFYAFARKFHMRQAVILLSGIKKIATL